MAAGRFKQHQLAGQEFSNEENKILVDKAIKYLKGEWEGTREINLDNRGRILIGTRTLPIEENINQQALSLLIGAHGETQALKGIDISPDVKLNPYDKEGIGLIQECIGRGLFSPSEFLQIASRGFRNPKEISTDDLSENFIQTTLEQGRGWEKGNGAAHNKQYSEAGHIEDDNLNPEKGQDINNISTQSRIVNKVTADSAKGRSPINPKYKSIIDQRNAALKIIKKTPIVEYTNDSENLDVYGSALDELINGIRNLDSLL